MSQKQEQYTKIITDEDNKKWFASLTEQEQTDLKLNNYRSFRNQKLQKTDAFIDAIDIDVSAFEQASDNVKASPWKEHIKVMHSSLNDFKPGYRYDLIVSNPPYFMDSFAASDEARNLARSASASLSYEDLLFGVGRLLSSTGKFSAILPFKEGQFFRELAEQSGLICVKLSKIKTGREKPFKRVLMEFSRREENIQEEELVIHFDNREFTEEYKKLTCDYYMAF